MKSDQDKSILQCVKQYQENATKRPKRHSVLEGQAESDQLVSSSADGELLHRKGYQVLTAGQNLTPPGAQLPQVKTKNFYGRNRQLLIDQRVAHLRANVQQRLRTNTVAPFEHFSLQRHAFAWAAEHELAADLRTFSVEHNTSGKRSFLVSTYEGFWLRYRDMLPDHRHYYEIIQESYPCHLYFDLEFQKGHNKALDGQGMVDRLLEVVAQQLKMSMQAVFTINMELAWVIELESDAPHKFSRHIIVNIPGKAFANNLQAGCFVNKVCQAAIDPGTSMSSLQVAKEDGTGSIVDTAVYTRNRAFRLYLSSKAGKGSILTSTGRFLSKAHSQKLIFLRSLICDVSPDAELLHCFGEHTQLQSHGKQAAPRKAATCQANVGPSPCPAMDAFIASSCNQEGSSYFPVVRTVPDLTHYARYTVCTAPFAQHIYGMQGGIQGSIRSWVHWDDIGAFLYNIKDNRWCGNINRAHKSNGIYIIADLQGGVWYQRCYDPDCRDYRSETMPLPCQLTRDCRAAAAPAPALQNSSTGVLKDHDDSDEAVMLAALDQYESKTGEGVMLC